jgi:branched-chain amino acid transport system permease protein
MSIFLQQFVNMLQLGSIYALLAIGFTIVYGIARLVNFAHGPIFMVSAYLLFFFGSFFYGFIAISWVVYLLSVLAASVITAGLAVLIEKIAYKPLREGPLVALVVSSVGVGMILEYGVLVTVGPVPKRMPALINDVPLMVGDVKFSLASIIIIVVATVSMVVLSLFIKKSRIGLALRAVSQDPIAASFMGISRNVIISVAFILGAVMATIGASLYTTLYFTFSPYIGDRINWYSFIAAVLGGIGSIQGAMLGGFILAALYVFGAMILPVSTYKDILVFAVLIIILLVKPTGLLGKRSSEKV